MNNTGLSKRIVITPILGWALADDELAIRVRSLLRWKIRYNSIHVEAEKGHVGGHRRRFNPCDPGDWICRPNATPQPPVRNHLL